MKTKSFNCYRFVLFETVADLENAVNMRINYCV